MSLPTVGNNDFRGYLNYLSQNSGDPNPGIAISGGPNGLGFVDNNGKISATDATLGQYLGGNTAQDTASSVSNFKNFVNNQYGNWNAQVLGDNTTTPNTTSSTPNLNASYIDIINGALGRLPGQLQQAENQIKDTYNTNNNELTSGKNQAQNSYDTSTTQNKQQFVTNKGQVNQQASTGLQGLLRLLGQHGAGGSSAALYAAPQAVSNVASQQLSGAKNTFGQNQQGLDTNWNNYETGFENSKKQLNDWLTQNNAQAEQKTQATRQSLLQQLIGLQPSVAAAQPYVDQINSSANQADALGNFNPTYTGKTPTYTAPTVASYTVNNPGAPTLGTPGNNTNAGTPALSFLLGLNKDKNNQNQLQPVF